MNRRIVALVVVAALFVGAGLALLITTVFDGDSDDGIAGPETTTTTTLPVSETGQELIDLLARGQDRTFHAVYVQHSTDGDETQLTVELWRAEDLVRQDITLEGGGVLSQVASFQLPEGNATCQRAVQGATEAEWQCAPMLSTATEAGAPAGVFDAAAADLGGKEVTAREDRVGDVDVRCFLIEEAALLSSEICVDDEGIPRRISAGGSDLILEMIEDDVDAAAFELPAPLPEPSAPPEPPEPDDSDS